MRTVLMIDRKSTRLNSSHGYISYAVFCLKKETPPLGSRGDLCPVRWLGLPDLDDGPHHQRDVVERVRSERSRRPDVPIFRAGVFRLDFRLRDALRPLVVAGPKDPEPMDARRRPRRLDLRHVSHG